MALCFGTGAALANPTGSQVVNGQVSVIQNGALLQITNSPSSIINWQSFSIGASEITRFIQQSQASAVLNRVTGSAGVIDPSVILGALQSNGRVFLVNPSGILFGAGAQVDVAGLVATSLNLSNSDFLAGKLKFTDGAGAGSVVNQGNITAGTGGEVYLIGNAVKNDGIIKSPNGDVMLAAGNSVELVNPGTPNLRVEITAPDNAARNLGQIVVDSGRAGIYAGLINNSGTIRADSVVSEGGKILLKATKSATLEASSVSSANGTRGGSVTVQSGDTTLVSGAVEAKGSAGNGGDVQVLGNLVGLTGNASVNASGDTGGGTVLVGGDFQGKNAEVQNAFRTYVGPDATIRADAGTSGDGGKVVVWSDDATRFYGTISARGGAASGNGGFVETSGKLGLDVTRGPDIQAPSGIGGTWLLDPNDLEVVAGQEITNNTAQPMFSTLGESSKIGVDLINLQLNFGSSVTLTTTSQGAAAGAEQGNITVSAPIMKTATGVGPATLMMQAHNNIVIGPGGGISSTGDSLSVTLMANSDSSGGGGVTVGGGGIVTNGGSVQIQGADAIAINQAINTASALGTSGGNVVLISNANAVNLAAGVTSGSFSASGSTGVNVNSSITTIGSGGISLSSSGGPVVVSQPLSGGFFSVSAGGAGGFTLASSVTGTGASVIADNLDIQGMLNAGAGGVSVRQFTSGRPMDLGTNTAGAVGLTSTELSNLVTSGSYSFGNGSTGALTVSAPMTAPASVSIASASTITTNAPVSVTGNLNASASTSITTNSTVAASGSLSVNSPVITIGAPLSVTGNLNASASTSITTNSTVTASGTLSANSPTITIGAPLSAQDITLTTDNIAVNALVTSATDVDVVTRSFFRPVNLGVVADSGTSLDMSAAELNNLATGAANALHIGSTSSGTLTIQGAIAPAGTQTLVLSSGNSVGQAAGATITVPNLGLNVFGSVVLPEDNAVGTLAASLCCSNNTFSFRTAPGALLNIGTVAGISGLSNFDSGDPSNPTIATLTVDGLNVSAPVSFDLVNIAPRSPAAVRLDLGGADAAGTLGISAADLANVFAGTLTLKADLADISAPVTSSAGVLAIAPFTGGRVLNITGGPKNAANLEFTPAEIGNVSASSFVLGDAGTGPVNVNAALAVPGSIAAFGLQSGDTATGITVNSALSATGNLALLGDTMSLNAGVSSTSGAITIATNTGGRPIDLGTKTADTLGLNVTELGLITASNGPLFVGDTNAGDLTVSAPLTFTTIGDLNLTTGGTLAINSALTNTSLGAINLTADAMNVAAAVVTGGGDINVRTASPFTSIALGTKPGGQLGLTPAELDQFDPSAGVLRIGDLDFNKSFNIQVTAPIAPASANTLSLQTANGGVTQTAGSTITVPSLAVQANFGITLTQNNNTPTVALAADFGDISYTHLGTGATAIPLNIGTVDGISGIQASSGGDATIVTDLLNINSFIQADRVFVSPLSVGRPLNVVGTKVGGVLELTPAEINSIFTDVLTLGGGSTGSVTVATPLTIGSAGNLVVTTGGSNAINVNSALTIGGDIVLTSGTLNVAAPLTSSFGQIAATADSMTFSAGPATVSAPSQIVLAPRNGTTVMNLGGPDVVSTTNTLGLDSTDLAALSTPFVFLGNGIPASITVSAPTNLGTTSASLSTSVGGAINVNAALATTGDLALTADDMSIAGPVSGANITLATVNGSRTIDLGTLGSGTLLGLDAASLGLISASNRLAFTGGTIAVSNPVTITAPALTLQAGTLNVNGTLTAPGDVTLLANAMDIANTVSSTGGGTIVAAPSGFTSMTLGPTTGSGLVLSAAEINQFATTGALHLGDFMTTNSISVAAPINAGTVGALTLVANGGISQTAGSTITAGNLGLQSFSTVTLAEANNVGTVAGFGGNFTFTNNGLLNIGSVDGLSGISGSNVTLKGDTIAINEAVSGFTVTLAPRAAGAAIDVGSKPGGVFGVSDAEIDLISASTLNIGQNTSGSITVSAPVDRASGNFNLVAQPGSSINVNATFASANSGVSMNAGAGGAVNIGAAVSAFNNVSLTAGAININAPVSSSNSSVTVNGGAGGTVNVGAQVTAFSNITLTADNVNLAAPLVTTGSTVTIAPATAGLPVNVGTETAGALSLTATELALIDTDILTIGSSSAGPLTVSAPFSSAILDQLTLRSGAAITQNPGAAIALQKASGGTLQAISSSGGVNMLAANEVPSFLFGSAAGAGSDFDFNNALPMKLQDISVSAGGKVRIFSGLFAPLPLLGGDLEVPPDQTTIAFGMILGINGSDDFSEQSKKDEEEKRKNTQSCH